MPQKIVVVGGGPVGALAACIFAMRGSDVTLVERRPDMRKTGAASGRSINLALSARGIAALVCANVSEKLSGKLVPMSGRMIHGTDGKLSSQAYGVQGECIHSVDRQWINQTLLSEAASRHVKILFETSLERASFDDRTLILRTYSVII